MTKKDLPPVDDKRDINYWIKLAQKLQEENERLKEKLRSFRGY